MVGVHYLNGRTDEWQNSSLKNSTNAKLACLLTTAFHRGAIVINGRKGQLKQRDNRDVAFQITPGAGDKTKKRKEERTGGDEA